MVIQKVWRSYSARKEVRERWMRSWREWERRAGEGDGWQRGLRVLVSGADADIWEDVVDLSRGVSRWGSKLLEGVGVGDRAGCADVPDPCLLVRDLFQLSLRCLSVWSGEHRRVDCVERFGCVRGMTWGEMEAVALSTSAASARDPAGAGDIEGDLDMIVACSLVGWVVRVVRERRGMGKAWFGASWQAVCLREIGWGGVGGGKVWRSRAVRDVVSVLVARGEKPIASPPAVSAAEMMLTNVLVCLFSSEGVTGRDENVLIVMMGVPMLFSRCASAVPLAGKVWASAVGCVRGLLGGDFQRNDLHEHIRQAIPSSSMEPLLVNLVQCIELLYAQGRFGSTGSSTGSISRSTSISPEWISLMETFMSLVNLVLDDEMLGGSTWKVSADSFVQPLAEANVIVVMATALLKNSSDTKDPSDSKTSARVLTLCRFVHRLLAASGSGTSALQTKLILTLAIKANLAGILWDTWLKQFVVTANGRISNGQTDLTSLDMLPALILFCDTFAMSLNVLGDVGFYDRGLPMKIQEVYNGGDTTISSSVLELLKASLWQVVWHERVHSELSLRFLKAGGKLLTLLHERNGRKSFAPHDAFYATSLPRESFHAAAVAAIGRGDIDKMLMEISDNVMMVDDDDNYGDLQDASVDATEVDGGGPAGRSARSTRWSSNATSAKRVVDLLQYAYPLVPFLERVRVFQSIVQAERVTIGDSESMSGVFFGGMTRERFVTVQRGRVLDDAYGVLGQRKSSVDVKKRIRISFVNEFGEQEAGIDGGGVFKEFLESVVRESVAADKGLFLSTTDNKLYPAPTASLTRNQLDLIEFVGMMIGKALWEGILLELPLASFFLKKIRGAPSGVMGVDDLPSLDPEMAKNLSYLAQNPESVADMGLTFSISTENPTKDVELVPGGSRIAVTADNVAHFIHRVANFKLNEQIQASCESFLSGFHAIIPKEWVRSFNDSELQMLIAGAEGDARMDLADLQRHVVYTGGYDDTHHTIVNLWSVLDGMNNGELADFLRFVTSCPRPPILGFASLQPPLTIQMIKDDEERLPTAATCVNLLKLPAYRSLETLREKLLYAIGAGAGFDLS